MTIPSCDLREWAIGMAELRYSISDACTREQGRLIKWLSVTDLTGFSLWSFDRSFARWLGAESQALEDFYPQ